MKYKCTLFCLCVTTHLLPSCGGGGSSQGSTANSNATEAHELPDAVATETRLRAASVDMGGCLQIQELRFINPQLAMMRDAEGWQEREEELFEVTYSKIDATRASLSLLRTVQKNVVDLNDIGSIATQYKLELSYEKGTLRVIGTERTGDYAPFRDPSFIESTEQIDSVIEWVTPE